MDITYLIKTVTLILTISVADERLVELIKSRVDGWETTNPNPAKECERLKSLQLLSLFGGWVSAAMAWEAIKAAYQQSEVWQTGLTCLLFGLCASGGSSFWNSVLTYLLKVKDIKADTATMVKSQALTEQAMQAAAVAHLREPLNAVAKDENLPLTTRAHAQVFLRQIPFNQPIQP